MRVYRMPVIVRSPAAETEDKYLVEVPVLPGCRAWGDTMAEALMYAQGVAAAFIASYEERGEPLPGGVQLASDAAGSSSVEAELLVTA